MENDGPSGGSWERLELPIEGDLGRLKLMRKPPQLAHFWGLWPAGPWVSLVGTRRPTERGILAAFELARKLAERGVCVVSGGAVGIDTAAHEGALAAGGKTLVVAPTWLPKAYPRENWGLFERVLAAKGGYLTIGHADAQPFNSSFFRRNEVLAALSDAIVVGDCPPRSGARNAMLHARRMNKPRFWLPGEFGHPTSVGGWMEAHELGAMPIVDCKPIFRVLPGFAETEEAGDSLADPKGGRRSAHGRHARPVGTHAVPSRNSPCIPSNLDAHASVVARAVSGGARTPDAIAAQTGIDIASVQHQVLILTLQGLVFQDESGVLRYQAPSDD